MKTNKSLISFIASLLALSTLVGCNKPAGPKEPPAEGEYNIVWDKTVHLNSGDITSKKVKFHFEERSVNERPKAKDCFVEIGAFGALYLTSYLPGILKVKVEAYRTEEYQEGAFILGKSSTPNNVEDFSLYSETYDFIDITPDNPYFSVHNYNGNVLKIARILIQHDDTITDPEDPLKKVLQLDDMDVVYDKDHPVRPYDQNSSFEVPANRIVQQIGPEEYNEPGEYKIGYEVYSKNDDGTPKKMLYSLTSMLKIHGAADSKHLAIFHLPEKKVILEVPDFGRPDITSNEELTRYNWENSFNDFVSPMNKDRDFYPTLSAVGIPSLKNGDGCYPVSARFTLLDKVVEMPDPTMKPGYKFAGWYMDHECTEVFDPEGGYTNNLTLYAKCIKETRDFRKVYYYDYDGTFLNRLDLLFEDEELTLPTFDEVDSKLPDYFRTGKMYSLSSGANKVAMLRPEGDYPSLSEGGYDHYDGDKLTNELVSGIPADVKLTVSKFEIYDSGPANFTQLDKDTEGNYLVSGYQMDKSVNIGNRLLPGRYIKFNREKVIYDYDDPVDPSRSDGYLITDAVYGCIADQGSYRTLATHAYANMRQIHSKPLDGILRHESVLKVGRRAFFNRYGLKGTYFPRNARTFENESYSNTMFNGVLQLPKTLTKIGKRAFVGSENIHYVMLPKTLTTIEADAFSLGSFNETNKEFENIKARTEAKDKIVFYYEGTELDFAKLDQATRNEINRNGRVIYNCSYNVYYGQ